MEITIDDHGFSPSRVTLYAGTQIQFHWSCSDESFLTTQNVVQVRPPLPVLQT